MLKPVLQNKMLAEHRILYDLKMPLSDQELKERIQNSVRHIRKSYRRGQANKLEERLDNFGNKGGRYFTYVKEKIKRLYKDKSIPNTSIGKWRSIEFELIFKSSKACEEFGYALRSVGLGDYVTIKKDNSIKLNPYDGEGIPHEIVLSYCVGNEKMVRDFCKCLKGRAYVNYSCGTHFHIDMRNMSEEKVTTFGMRIARTVPVLRLLLPKDRRDSKFCQKIINTTDTGCAKCGKICNCNVQPHKYAFVNLAAFNKHKTIEVRGHSGTINADKILNWIKLCEVIMLTPEENITKEIHSTADLIKVYKLDKDLAQYVNERFKKFADGDYWTTGSAHKKATEGEETPDGAVEVPVHPAFLAPVPAAKQAQAGKVPPPFPGVAALNWQ